MAEHEGKQKLTNALAYIKKNSGCSFELVHLRYSAVRSIANYVASLEARVAELEATCERAAKIIDTNLYRQDEKVSDASTILKAAISDGIGSPITYAIEQAVAKERERCAARLNDMEESGHCGETTQAMIVRQRRNSILSLAAEIIRSNANE